MASSVLIEKPALPTELLEARDVIAYVREELAALIGDGGFRIIPSPPGRWFSAVTLRPETLSEESERAKRLALLEQVTGSAQLPHGVEYVERLHLLKVWSSDPRAVLMKVRRLLGLAE